MFFQKITLVLIIFFALAFATTARSTEHDYELQELHLDNDTGRDDNVSNSTTIDHVNVSNGTTTDDIDPIHQLRIKIQEHVDPSSPIHKYADDDLYILQWLKSNAFNVEIAESKFMDHLAWRRNHSVDKLDDDNWLTFSVDFPIFADTTDNSGRPTAEVWLSDWNIRTAISKGLSERLMRWQAHMLEKQQKRLFETRRQGNKNVTGSMLIQDFDGFNMLKHGCTACVPLLKEMLRVWEQHYAGIFEHVYIVNLAQPYSNILKRRSKQFTPAAVPDALRPYHYRRDWLPILEGLMDRSQRSDRFGGTLIRNVKLRRQTRESV